MKYWLIAITLMFTVTTSNAGLFTANDSPTECETGYYKNDNNCSELPGNAIAIKSSEGFFCKSGYKWNGSRCISIMRNEIVVCPPNTDTGQ
jgi:hypothetical protein